MPPVIRQGQFWWVQDEVIVFPDNRERDPHESRGCIIIEGDESLARGGTRVQVIPTTSQVQYKDVYDVVVPSPPLPGGSDTIVLVQHLQPIRREELKSLVVPLKQEWLDMIIAAHLKSIGIEAEDDPGEDPTAAFGGF